MRKQIGGDYLLKIGEFSQKHNVTIDTIRHYMEKGLILPEKIGGHYQFDNQCSKDLQEVLELRKLDFGLSEIRHMMSFKRISNLKLENEKDYYKCLLFKQKQKLIEEKKQISIKIHELDKKMNSQNLAINNHRGQMKNISCGVPLGILPYITCSHCNKNLTLNNGNINNNTVIKGILNCKCGFIAKIVDGIIVLNDLNENIEDIDYKGFQEVYTKNTPESFVELIYKSFKWCAEKLSSQDLSGKIVLEAGTGLGVFLSYIYDKIADDCFYIAIDKDINKILYTKKYLEEKSGGSNIVYICTDFSELPIKNNSLDLVVDIGGSIGWNLKKTKFLFELFNNKIKLHGKWLGHFFYFDDNSHSLLKFDEELRPYFKLQNIKKQLKETNFYEIESKEQGYAKKGGKYEDFFVEGDKAYEWNYFGMKSK